MLIPPSPVGVAMAAMVSLIVKLGKAGSGYTKRPSPYKIRIARKRKGFTY